MRLAGRAVGGRDGAGAVVRHVLVELRESRGERVLARGDELAEDVALVEEDDLDVSAKAEQRRRTIFESRSSGLA